MKSGAIDHGVKVASAAVARGLAVCGTVLLATVVSRSLGPDALGEFFLVLAILTAACTVSTRGAALAIVRFAGRDASSEELPFGYLVCALRRLAGTWIILVGITAPALFVLGPYFALYKAIGSALWLGIVIVPLLGVCGVLGGYEIGRKNPVGGALLQPGFLLLQTAGIVGFLHLFDMNFSIVGVFACLAMVSFVTGGLATVLIFRRSGSGKSRGQADTQVPDVTAFRSSANTYFWTEGGIQLQQLAATLLIVSMIGEVALGQFRLVERFALLASFPLTVVNSVYPGHIAEAYFEGNLARLQRLAGSMSLLALMGALPVVLVGALQPEFLLGLAGEPIAGSALLLRILLIVQLFNAATGPAGLVLFMAGKEAWVRRVVLGVSILSVPLGAVAIWQIGTVGAALMVSAVVISNNLAFFVLNVRKLGIVPLPSFGSLRIVWQDEERR